MRSSRLSHILTSLLVFGALAISGCSSARSGDDVLATDAADPVRKGAYPDFSAPLDSAMAQMTDQEAADQEARLSVLARQRQSGAISAAEYQRRVEALRLLGKRAQE